MRDQICAGVGDPDIEGFRRAHRQYRRRGQRLVGRCEGEALVGLVGARETGAGVDGVDADPSAQLCFESA